MGFSEVYDLIKAIYLMRLSRRLFVSSAVAALAARGAAQTNDQCSIPVYTQSFIDDAGTYWGSDVSYVAKSLNVLPNGENKQVWISGDTLLINETNFASLSRVSGQAVTGLKKIVFDGRRVIVDMPIRLRDASISLFGEEIIFGPSGSISIQAPPRDEDQLVEIVTTKLDLSKARPLPFNFATRDWTVPISASRWPTTGGAERRLRINAKSVIPENSASQLDRELLSSFPTRFFFRRTLDKNAGAGIGISGAGGNNSDGPVWENAYEAALDSRAEYDVLLGQELLWPLRTSQKIERLFVRAPYDPEVAEFLEGWLDQLQPYFLEHGLVTAVSKLQSVRFKLSQGLDRLGLTAFDVPMTDFQNLIDDFKESLDSTFGSQNSGGLLAAWDEQLIASLDTGTVDGEAIKEAKSRLDDLNDRVGVLTESTDEVVSRLEAVTFAIVEETTRSEEVTADIRADWDRKQQDLQSLGQALEVVKFVGVAASVFFPAAAPVILGVTQAIATAGAGAVAHNSGEEVGFSKLIELTKEGAEEYKKRKDSAEALGKVWNSAKENWSKITDSFDPAWDEVTDGKFSGENVRAFSESASSFFKSIQELLKGLGSPTGPQTVKIPEFAANDGRMSQIMSNLSALRTEESALRANLAVLGSELLQKQDQLVSQAALVKELQRLDLKNNVDLLKLRQISTDLRRNLLFSLARSASLILRGSVYHTGQQLEIDAGVLTFAGDQLTRLENELDVTDPQVLREELNGWRAEAWRNYETLVALADEALKEWTTAQGGATPTVYTYTADLENPSNSDYWREGRDFLTAINSVLRETFNSRDDDVRSRLARYPIRIPWKKSAVSNFIGPEFLLGVVITHVDFSVPIDAASGRQVLLFVRHPRNGEVSYTSDGSSCLLAQDFASNGSSYTFSTSAPVDENTPGNELEKLQTINAFTELQNRSYPLRTSYYLTLGLPEPEAWESAPSITKMNISFVGIRKQ